MSRIKTVWKWVTTAIGWLIMIGLTVFLLEELVRIALWTIPEWGFWTAITDGVILHKLGELLILPPLAAFALFNRKLPTERVIELIGKSRWVIWSGALLNLVAVFSLADRVYWWAWPLLLAVVGGILPLLMMRWIRTRAIWPARTMIPPLVILLVLAYGVAWITSGYFMAPVAAPFPTPADTEAERWRQDLDYLASELPRLHKNAYHTISEEEFKARVADVRDRIPSMNEQQILTAFRALVASVGDGHTEFDYEGSEAGPAFRPLPVGAFWFEEGLFINEACKEYEELLGSRIIAINSRPIDAVYDSICSLLPNECLMFLKCRSPRTLMDPVNLYGLQLVRDPDSIEIAVETPDGDTLEVLFRADSERCSRLNRLRIPIPPPLFQIRQSEEYWHEVWPDKRTVYFQLNWFMDLISFPSYAEELFETIDGSGIQYLIIDFRDNPGGNSMVFDRFHELLKGHAIIDQPGHLYVLVNRASYSSATMCAGIMRRETNAILAGEKMGGELNHYGDLRLFKLPNRDAKVYYSTKLFTTWPDSLSPFGIDLPIPVTAEAYLAGEDPVLDTVLQLIESDLAGDPVANKDGQLRQ